MTLFIDSVRGYCVMYKAALHVVKGMCIQDKSASMVESGEQIYNFAGDNPTKCEVLWCLAVNIHKLGLLHHTKCLGYW